jgi:hypothetical protein
MIPYRFLSPAEEEMTETALFYEAASSRLGSDFLDDVQLAIDRLRRFPQVGELVDSDLTNSHSVLSIHSKKMKSWLSPLRTMDEDRGTGNRVLVDSNRGGICYST